MTEEIEKNHFEEVIDNLMLDQYSDEPELTEFIKTLPNDKKRLAILSLLDKDNNMWTKLKSMIGDNNVSKMDHIKDVVLMLREYVKIAEVEKKKFGEVMTPLDLVKEMLATLPKEVWSNPNLKWLDPANGTGPFPIMVIYKLMKGLEKWQPNEELRYKHIIENMIYVCELQPKNMFLYLCAIDPKDEYDCKIYTGSFLDEGFDNHMKNVWNVDKFDIVIGNPPYNRSIDLKFLNKSYNISDRVLFIHPSTWLIDERNQYTPYIKSKKLVGKHLESIKFFNGNHLFNIGLFVPCVITHINKYKNFDNISFIDEINNISGIYENIDEINKYSNTNEYISIKKKIHKKENLYTHLLLTNEYSFYVNVSPIRGHVNLKSDNHMLVNDFYTFVPRDKKVENFKKITETNLSMLSSFGFNTKNEAENFLNYIKTNFARFCLSVYKITQNQYSNIFEFIPWLDFSREWTDEDLIEEFNLTNEEVEFINKHIPKYY
jgi:hypothetical protein